VNAQVLSVLTQVGRVLIVIRLVERTPIEREIVMIVLQFTRPLVEPLVFFVLTLARRSRGEWSCQPEMVGAMELAFQDPYAWLGMPAGVDWLLRRGGIDVTHRATALGTVHQNRFVSHRRQACIVRLSERSRPQLKIEVVFNAAGEIGASRRSGSDIVRP